MVFFRFVLMEPRLAHALCRVRSKVGVFIQPPAISIVP